MAISWGTIKSLLIFFGPILLPKGIAYYRSLRASQSHNVSIQPIPPTIKRALLILLLPILYYIITTLPYFSPENIFSLTQSRLQIPTDVLFTRLSSLRPTGLTPSDDILRSKLLSLESRLLYFHHGPAVLAECRFCNAEDPNSYLYYSLPSILIPHIFNLCVLALVTSGLFTGKEGAKWRTTATLAAGAVTLLDIYLVCTYSYQSNARATRLEDLDHFYWTARTYRSLSLAILDILLSIGLYLSSTNRFFTAPPTTPERIEITTRILETATSKMQAMGIMRNTVNRDQELRDRSTAYWVHEGRLMGELMEDRTVVEGVNNALQERINMSAIERDAEAYAGVVVGPLRME